MEDVIDKVSDIHLEIDDETLGDIAYQRFKRDFGVFIKTRDLSSVESPILPYGYAEDMLTEFHWVPLRDFKIEGDEAAMSQTWEKDGKRVQVVGNGYYGGVAIDKI